MGMQVHYNGWAGPLGGSVGAERGPAGALGGSVGAERGPAGALGVMRCLEGVLMLKVWCGNRSPS